MRKSFLIILLSVAAFVASARVAHAEEGDNPAPAETAKAAEPAKEEPAAKEGEHKDGDAKEGEHADKPKEGEHGEHADGEHADKAHEGDHADAEGHLPHVDPAVYVPIIQQAITTVKDKVMTSMEEKMEEKNDRKMKKLATWLAFFSLSGLLLFLVPIFQLKKYPGKAGLLFKYSSISAVAAVLVINLFAAVLVLIKSVQGAMGPYTNPGLMIVEATFDSLYDEAEHLVDYGKALVEPTLTQLSGDTEDPMPVVLLENVTRLGKSMAGQVETFKSLANFFRDISWILEYVPTVLLSVTVILFAVSAKPVVVSLAQMPGKVAAGDSSHAKTILADAFKFVGREFLAAFCLIAFLIVVTMLSSFALSETMRPAVDAFLTYFFMNLHYVQTDPQASGSLILMSIGGTIFFLILNVVVIIVTGSFFLGKIHKIFQAKFQDKVPLGEHKRFWKWGVASVVWALALPVAFMYATDSLVDRVIEHLSEKETPNWSLIMLSGPAMLIGGFLIFFWALRGMKAIGFLFKYKPLEVTAAWKKKQGAGAVEAPKDPEPAPAAA